MFIAKLILVLYENFSKIKQTLLTSTRQTNKSCRFQFRARQTQETDFNGFKRLFMSSWQLRHKKSVALNLVYCTSKCRSSSTWSHVEFQFLERFSIKRLQNVLPILVIVINTSSLYTQDLLVVFARERQRETAEDLDYRAKLYFYFLTSILFRLAFFRFEGRQILSGALTQRINLLHLTRERSN